MFHVIRRVVIVVALLRPQKDVAIAFPCIRKGYMWTTTKTSWLNNDRFFYSFRGVSSSVLTAAGATTSKISVGGCMFMSKKNDFDNNDFFEDEGNYLDRDNSNGKDNGGANNIELLSLGDSEGLSDEMLSQLQEGQPSQLTIMKEVSTPMNTA